MHSHLLVWLERVIQPELRLTRKAADARPHDRQRLADALSLNPLDPESRRGDGRLRAAREMAIAHQVLPDRLDAALPFHAPGPAAPAPTSRTAPDRSRSSSARHCARQASSLPRIKRS